MSDLVPSPAARDLRAADAAITAALAAFPDRAAVADALHEAMAALDRLDALPPAVDVAGRLARKRRELSRAAAVALRFPENLDLGPTPLRAGQAARLKLAGPSAATVSFRLPAGWSVAADPSGLVSVHIPAEAPPFDTLRDGWEPLGGNDMAGATLTWTKGGATGTCEIDPPTPLALAPPRDVTVRPCRVARTADSVVPVVLNLHGAPPPPEWPALVRPDALLEISAPMGRLDLPQAGVSLTLGSSPRVGAFGRLEPANVAILRADIRIDTGARVGVIAGDVDTTLDWLRQLGIDAAAVDDATLAHGDLGRFTCLLVGILGFGQRPALAEQRERIGAWISAGGSLVTLYHRPSDGWDPGTTPPRRLAIGRPSIRWRVCDPTAPVTMLAPEHPLFRHPNIIAPSDWDGWVRERGLYFASEWDCAYTPLIAMSDPGEAPLRGALLAASIGRGRHVHVALALHHQFSALVAGAFRLLSNLVARTL
jgi:hypothetical protein